MHKSELLISGITAKTRDCNSRIHRTGKCSMGRLRKLVLPACFLFTNMFAHATVHGGAIHITVLDSETHSVILDGSGVPKNCDGVSFDAYCFNSKTTEVTNSLLVQEGNQPPFQITCSVDSKWSRCTTLPPGESFEARKAKRGIVVYYADDAGKLRKQFYAYAGEEPKSGTPEAAAPAASPGSSTNPTAFPAANAAASKPQTSHQAENSGASEKSVKCNFSSTPAGADITVDGQYVGSTPSLLNVSIGNHAVEVSMRGFAAWKRQLAVSSGAELTVHAVLEKTK